MLFNRVRIKLACVLVTLLLSFSLHAEIVKLAASLQAANQNGSDPAQVTDPLGVVETNASGSIQIQLDTDNNTLDYQLDVTGISRDQLRNFGPNETPIHLHLAGGGDPGNFGPIAIDLTLNAVDADFTSTTDGFQLARDGISILLEDQGGVQLGMHPGNDQIVDALRSGNTFVLVHTNKDIFVNDAGPAPGFPFGEIRGNIKPVSTITTPAHGMDIIVLKDAVDVPSAVAELKATLEQEGFKIPLIVDHSAAAASVDLELGPNQVMFARLPRVLEKQLLRRGKTVGLDLPIKFHVFEENGVIKLSVNTLGYLLDRHDLFIRDFSLRFTNRLMRQFGSSEAEEHGLITVRSQQSVEETVQALQDAITVNPAARIPLVLDYGEGNNRRHRVPLPVLIVFGNPNVGTPLMQADPRMGIDLPLKFLVWTDFQGRVNITYNDLRFLAGRINLSGVDDRLNAIAGALNNLARAGAGQDQN
ncbi:MAG TPA: DUF302 domain-containing protein [Crenotrichaceae bacterium]|nr:DUF302 domain-containing protein [Crenotrichaceae bacterium]